MNKVILCEGMTDAILLSYYLGKVSGWRFSNNAPSGSAIKQEEHNESINWYKKGNDSLLICSVGGKDNMAGFFQKKILRMIVDAGVFNRLAVVLDRDDNEVKSIEEKASNDFRPVITRMVNNEWVENTYTDGFETEQIIEALLVAIPTDHQGALETIMIDSIAEDPYDAEIVNRTKLFVTEMRKVAARYISNNRKELKAHLGVTWAIQYPEKVFSLIDEQIKSVPWEDSEILRQCFEKLIEI